MMDVALLSSTAFEMAGEVVAVGDDVVRVRVGDRVTAPFVLGCGRCDVCEAGHEHICPNQFQFGFRHQQLRAARILDQIQGEYRDTGIDQQRHHPASDAAPGACK